MEIGDAAGRRSRLAEAERFGREILPAVSRTFALSIRVLPGELGRAVLDGLSALSHRRHARGRAGAARAPTRRRCSTSCCAASTTPRPPTRFPRAWRHITGEPAHVRLTRHADLVFVLYRALSAGHARRTSAAG